MAKFYKFPVKPLGLLQRFENVVRKGMDINSVPKEQQEEVIKAARTFFELPGDVMKKNILELVDHITRMNDYENAVQDERRKLEKEIGARKDEKNVKEGYRTWPTTNSK